MTIVTSIILSSNQIGVKMNIQNLLRSYGIKSIWHFTDKSNLTSIENLGLLSLKNIIRSHVNVSCYGATRLSHEQDIKKGLDKFVHLSFIKDHPMYHVAKRDGRIPNPVWIEIDLSVLDKNNTLFSNMLANTYGAPIFYANKLKRMINFDTLLHGRDFDSRKEARKAEIMVANNISYNDIKGIYYGY
jgi:hypothetical protein